MYLYIEFEGIVYGSASSSSYLLTILGAVINEKVIAQMMYDYDANDGNGN